MNFIIAEHNQEFCMKFSYHKFEISFNENLKENLKESPTAYRRIETVSNEYRVLYCWEIFFIQ